MKKIFQIKVVHNLISKKYIFTISQNLQTKIVFIFFFIKNVGLSTVSIKNIFAIFFIKKYNDF